jgi:hypothetical protein
MDKRQHDITSRLRQMAREGDSVARMVRELKHHLGAEGQIVAILEHLRSAFCLSLAEVKPVAALSRNAARDIEDESLLEELIQPSIHKHRREWDTPSAGMPKL